MCRTRSSFLALTGPAKVGLTMHSLSLPDDAGSYPTVPQFHNSSQIVTQFRQGRAWKSYDKRNFGNKNSFTVHRFSSFSFAEMKSWYKTNV